MYGFHRGDLYVVLALDESLAESGAWSRRVPGLYSAELLVGFSDALV